MVNCTKDKTALFCGSIHQIVLILPVVLTLVRHPQKQNYPEKRKFLAEIPIFS
jgi:hypothetical protein